MTSTIDHKCYLVGSNLTWFVCMSFTLTDDSTSACLKAFYTVVDLWGGGGGAVGWGWGVRGSIPPSQNVTSQISVKLKNKNSVH